MKAAKSKTLKIGSAGFGQLHAAHGFGALPKGGLQVPSRPPGQTPRTQPARRRGRRDFRPSARGPGPSQGGQSPHAGRFFPEAPSGVPQGPPVQRARVGRGLLSVPWTCTFPRERPKKRFKRSTRPSRLAAKDPKVLATAEKRGFLVSYMGPDKFPAFVANQNALIKDRSSYRLVWIRRKRRNRLPNRTEDEKPQGIRCS